MVNLCGVLLLLTFATAEWVEIPSPPKRSGAKGEEANEPLVDSSNCLPDIHSWTSATWKMSNNSSRGAEPMPPGPRSSEGKLIILRALHEDLMTTIANRVDDLGESREARTIMPKGMGTKESALITISLLTFAVYLIKLVTMLINVIQEKKGEVKTGLLQATPQPSTQTFVVAHGRKKRAHHDVDTQFLNAMKQSYKGR